MSGQNVGDLSRIGWPTTVCRASRFTRKVYSRSRQLNLCATSRPPERRRAEASLHARCLAAALSGVPRWGASQASTTELEGVARAPAEAGPRPPASGSRTGAGSATSKGDQYPVCVILAERILVMDKPPTHDGGTKESFEQDKQKLVPQGAQTEETEAERSARERALERDYA